MFKTFFKEEMGQDMAEYSLLLAAMVVATAAVIVVLKDNIGGIFTDANTGLTSARVAAS